MRKAFAALLLSALMPWSGSLSADDRDLAGRYDLDAKQSDDIQAAIDAGTADMNFAIRPIARNRTARINPQYEHIAVTHDAKGVTVVFDEEAPVQVSFDGRPSMWTREDGAQWAVTVELNPSRLTMLMTADKGERINTFELSPDGQTMALHVELSSPRLPAPIRYTLVYRRHTS
jgi:hypothetical protein